jgi:hypothetical protein
LVNGLLIRQRRTPSVVDKVGVGFDVGDSLIMEKLSKMGAELKQEHINHSGLPNSAS